MKALAINVLAGPVLMLLVCGVGMACGYYVGLIPACVVVVVVAIALGLRLARFAERVTAVLAVVLAALAGVAGAYGCHQLRELHTGAFARDVRLADLATLRGKDRLTLRDGLAREDLSETASETSRYGGPSDRQEITTSCRAYPIVPEGWTPAEPVPVWRFSDDDHGEPESLRARVFHPSEPDELCRKAIDRATAEDHLAVAPHPIYLEGMVSDSADAADNLWKGPFAVALLGGLWIMVALYTGARDALADRRRGPS